MYIQRNKIKGKTGKTYTAAFLCTKYREGGKVKTRVEANLSSLPEHLLLCLENALKSPEETMVKLGDIAVSKCVDYGYLHVLVELMKQLRIEEVLQKTLDETTARNVKAMIIGKIITGGSKPGIHNWLDRETEACKILEINPKETGVKDLYSSLGKLNGSRDKVKNKWFRYHKSQNRRVYLYDITSVYSEGQQNELAAFGYSRDGKKGKKQICVGLITDEDGFPCGIEVFEGNTADSATVSARILKLKKEFNVDELVFVGDRGMHIIYHLENDDILKTLPDIGFITGLSRDEIRQLIDRKVFQPELFTRELAEVVDGDRRYVLSLNPELQKSEILYYEYRKTQLDNILEDIKKSWEKRREKNLENIERLEEGKTKNKKLKTRFSEKDVDLYKKRVNRAVDKCGMSKYYAVDTIDNDRFEIKFDSEKFGQSKNLCGKYVVATNVATDRLSTEDVRRQYKNLQNVEHAFRDLKSDNIAIRPVYHRNESQTHGHVTVCFFAYAIIKHMESKIYPFLTDYNKNHKSQLSFNDIVEELKNIKICELKIGKNAKAPLMPELNSIQADIFNLFKLNPNNMINRP